MELNTTDLIQSIALVISLIGSAAGIIFESKRHHSAVMTTKRSERIDQIRQHSAGILSCWQYLRHNIDPETNTQTKKELIHHGHSLISLLQYYSEYQHDMLLIKKTQNIIERCLCDKIDYAKLEDEIKEFWWICNVYVGADFERLSIEAEGKIAKGGASDKEANTFGGLYKKFNKDATTLFPDLANPSTPDEQS